MTPTPPTNPEALLEALLEFAEKYELRTTTSVDREMTVDALMSDFFDPLLAQRDAALAERDEARDLAYQLKLAAAGGEDVPGSGQAVTVEDVNRWRVEALQREEAATAQAERTAGELAAAEARVAELEAIVEAVADGYRPHKRGLEWTTIQIRGSTLADAHRLSADRIDRTALTEEPPHAA